MSIVKLEVHVWKEFASFCSTLAKSVKELFASNYSHTTDKSVCFFIVHRHLTAEKPRVVHINIQVSTRLQRGSISGGQVGR